MQVIGSKQCFERTDLVSAPNSERLEEMRSESPEMSLLSGPRVGQ